MNRKIPATVVTGFLGAGKTSLIRHLLAHGGRRLALIINEFGDLGVDRELLAGCGIPDCSADDIIELANGCICCTVADDFLPAMDRLLTRQPPPEHILIETSGLALPKPLVKAFAWPEMRTRVTVDGVVAVVDAEAVAAGRFAADAGAVEGAADHDSPLEELFEEQIQCADLVVLNKADRLAGPAMGAVAAAVARHLRPAVKTIAAQHGAIEPRVLLGLDAAAEDDLDSRPSHHESEADGHDHDEFESFVVPLAPVADPAQLAARIRVAVAANAILRVKGFVAVDGKPMRHAVQGVGDRIEHYYDRPWRPGEVRRGALVVIGVRGLDRGAIAAALGA